MPSFAETHNTAELLEQCSPDTAVYSDIALPMQWKLDQKMRESFAPHFAMWEQGLIHSMELFKALRAEVHKERN